MLPPDNVVLYFPEHNIHLSYKRKTLLDWIIDTLRYIHI